MDQKLLYNVINYVFHYLMTEDSSMNKRAQAKNQMMKLSSQYHIPDILFAT